MSVSQEVEHGRGLMDLDNQGYAVNSLTQKQIVEQPVPAVEEDIAEKQRGVIAITDSGTELIRYVQTTVATQSA